MWHTKVEHYEKIHKFKRVVDVRLTAKMYYYAVKEAVGESKKIVGIDLSASDGFNLILKDSRGVYRKHTESASLNFIRAKFICAAVKRLRVYYRDVFFYKTVRVVRFYMAGQQTTGV